MADSWACLNCGAELEHDWMPCPRCGWQAPGPGEEAFSEPEEGTPQARFHLFSRRTTFLKILAVLLALVFTLLIVNWIWRFF